MHQLRKQVAVRCPRQAKYLPEDQDQPKDKPAPTPMTFCQQSDTVDQHAALNIVDGNLDLYSGVDADAGDLLDHVGG